MRKLIRIYCFAEDAVMVILLGALLLMSFGQVGGRLLLNMGFQSGDAIIYHLVLWTGLWGALLATRQQEHITIDIVSRFASLRYRTLIRIITNLFSGVICSILVHASIRFIHDEMTHIDTEILHIPLWVYELIIPYAFAVMSIRFFWFSIMEILLFIHPTQTGPGGSHGEDIVEIPSASAGADS